MTLPLPILAVPAGCDLPATPHPATRTGRVMICEFNGAKDAGEDRFDPRFDCDQPAVWHILLAVDARELSMTDTATVFACEAHAVNVHRSTAMLHRVDPAACGQPGLRWRLTTNACG